MCDVVKSPADQQFRRHCQIAVGLSLFLYIACSQASLRLHNTAMGIVLAGIAGASIFAELVSVGLLLTRLRDEFQRALLTRSFIWGTVITMALTMIWGFIELHARGVVPHLNIIWIPIILVFITTAAKLLIFRQYRPGNE
jgi:hypothetical protein